MTTAPRDSLVWKLAGLLRESGDVVLSGHSTLTLLTATLQHLNHVFELHLGPWGPGQIGFVALPSHPADSPIILQLQFLFDVLQKTLSLKLVHVPGLGLSGPIKIFPFKSLRQLELRGVPLHCLHGLRGIYSQLETLICSRSLQALEELLSACGGDLCSALPWLARIILYDTSSKKLVKTLVADAPLTAVDFMPDGATLAIGSSRGKIYQYDLRMLKSPIKTISAHKTSVQCIAFQYSTVLSKSGLNKGCSNKPTAVNKRTVNVSAGGGGAQNPGVVREAATTPLATVLPQPTAAAVGKGTAGAPQDKAGLPRSINTDTLSKETESGKNQDFSSFDDSRKSSLGDMFSPVRDDAVVNKGGDESIGKGDGLDFLPQLNSVFPPRKNPVVSSTPVLHSSPLNVFMGSPGKEENENHDLTAESKKMYLGKQESKDSFKQFAKLISGAETGNLNASPSSNQTRSPEKFEKPEKEIEAQLINEPPGNGSSTPNPKIASSVTSGVASSLSEKIVDTIGNSRPNAPLSSVQIRFIQNMIQETLDDFREACHRDIVNLQVEMIKQFHMQLNEMHSLLERYSVNEGLVAEIERLREENKRLRAHF